MIHSQLTVSVGLIEYKKKYLVTRRYDTKNQLWHHRWQLPGGKIQVKETPLDALHREIFEETQLTILNPKLLGIYTHNWEFENKCQQTFILLYYAKALHDKVLLNPNENDAFLWQDFSSILNMDNLLDSMAPMFKELCLYRFSKGRAS